MNINKFTTKSQEALRMSQEIALSRSNPQMDTAHLLYALLLQEESIVPVIVGKLDVDIEDIKGATLTHI